MAINKVIYGGETLIDLTGDTVAAADVASGFAELAETLRTNNIRG